jgi:hypothetical protein
VFTKHAARVIGARSLPLVASDTVLRRNWTVAQKARMLAEASNLSGDPLRAYLERELARKEKPWLRPLHFWF